MPKRLYYCKPDKDADWGDYVVATSSNKARSYFWNYGSENAENFFEIRVKVLPKYNKVIKKYPIGHFNSFKEIGLDTSGWDS